MLRGMVVGGLGKQKYLEDDEERRMSSKAFELNITFRHTFLNIVKYLRILDFQAGKGQLISKANSKLII